MEKQKSKLTSFDIDVLDELVFTNSYRMLNKKFKDEKLYFCLVKLLNNKLITIYFPTPDDEIEFEVEKFDANFREYYYLATKIGLKSLFG